MLVGMQCDLRISQGPIENAAKFVQMLYNGHLRLEEAMGYFFQIMYLFFISPLIVHTACGFVLFTYLLLLSFQHMAKIKLHFTNYCVKMAHSHKKVFHMTEILTRRIKFLFIYSLGKKQSVLKLRPTVLMLVCSPAPTSLPQRKWRKGSQGHRAVKCRDSIRFNYGTVVMTYRSD